MRVVAWLKSLFPKPEPTLEERFKTTFGDRACFLCAAARGAREFGKPYNPPPHKCPEDPEQRGYRT